MDQGGRTARKGAPGIVDAVKAAARPLRGLATDYDELVDAVAGARVVLLGEASHGTHEFYRERALITRRLIEEKGFHGVAAEADWPDAYRVTRFVRGLGGDADAAASLGDFRRFPAWMWRNEDVLDFVDWLRRHNDGTLDLGGKAGFWGLDLYSLSASMAEVVRYLARVNPEAAERARARYACFDHYEDDVSYGAVASESWLGSCEEQVLGQLVELQKRAAELLVPDGQAAQDELFYAQQNARVAKNAEEYYRSMFRGRVSSWNLRDRHMVETLEALLAHLDRQVGDGRAKLVVWAHNSHLGDARATEMRHVGELNVGQLARERFGDGAALVGFTTYGGTVMAASHWDGEGQRKRVRPALPGSYEALFHDVGSPRFFLPLRNESEAAHALAEEERLERAIGVIYRPDTERASHYFHARLGRQFDFVLHFDDTRAVQPLPPLPARPDPDAPETFPHAV